MLLVVSKALGAVWKAQLVVCLTHDRMVMGSILSRNGGKKLFSRVNFLCQLLYSVSALPGLWQWRVKDPSHSA